VTLMHSRSEITSASGPAVDPEALFKEARQRRRRRWILSSRVVGLLALSLGVGVLVAGGTGGGGGPSSVVPGPYPHHSGPGTSVSPGSTGSFAVVATGVLADAFDCASERTCFAVAYPQPGDALHDWSSSQGRHQVAKTADGGATWKRIADFPDQWTPEPVMSCPTVAMCAIAVQPVAPHNDALPSRAIAITRDGGSSWIVHELPLPPDLIDGSVHKLTCTDGSHCLAYVVGKDSSGPHGSFLSSSDGGARWVDSDTIVPATEVVRILRCDLDGRCIALATSGPGMATLTSADFGASWTQGTESSVPTSAIITASCGDATHCMYSTVEGGLESTENGGETWGVSRVSIPSGQIITALDCANGMDCFAAAARWHEGNYTSPVVYRTSNGGQAWTSLEVPSRADGWFVSTVVPLSCPTPGGCIGIAQASPPSSRPMTRRLVVSTFR
jgi:photosystem II stability/assembly factor-like uncharacterized protein